MIMQSKRSTEADVIVYTSECCIDSKLQEFQRRAVNAKTTRHYWPSGVTLPAERLGEEHQ